MHSEDGAHGLVAYGVHGVAADDQMVVALESHEAWEMTLEKLPWVVHLHVVVGHGVLEVAGKVDLHVVYVLCVVVGHRVLQVARKVDLRAVYVHLHVVFGHGVLGVALVK